MKVRWLLWDDWNRSHIARHEIVQDEIEQMVGARYLARKARSGCYIIYGRSHAGRYMAVVVAPRTQGAAYVVTARDMTGPEKKRFRRHV